MKYIIVLVFFIPALKSVDGKCAILHSTDKTQNIIKNIKLDTLCIINPIVFCAFVNRETIEKFNDSLFNTHIDTYSEESLGEENLSLCSHRYLDNYFEDVPHFFYLHFL